MNTIAPAFRPNIRPEDHTLLTIFVLDGAPQLNKRNIKEPHHRPAHMRGHAVGKAGKLLLSSS
jgi:hypothetical protein